MSTRQMLRGKCSFCSAGVSKTSMADHLKSCEQRKDRLESSSEKRAARKTKVFHIVVEGRYRPEYWMHLEAPASATLKDMDGFLRNIWVECCGHLSAFTIGKVRYERETGGVDSMWPMIFGRRIPPKSMNIRMASVLHPGLEFHYEYDFGTTTHLMLSVLSEREGNVKGRAIQILARNQPPQITCEVCGEKATQVCSQCIWDNRGWLCGKCGRKHKCGEDMLLPAVNSPRVGMCAYTGRIR